VEGEIMKKAIVYCRLAAADQESDARLETQKRDCLQYARIHDYQILEVISEVASGINPNRKGLQRLLDLCVNSKIDAVLVQDFNRLSRDLKHTNALMQTFAKTNTMLISVATPFLETIVL
jgi:DNA invertase Pin-like site-specific DNA recombinase